MIAVDTSALVAIVFNEPERHEFLQVVQRSESALVSTVTVVESRLVVHSRRGERGLVLLDDLLRLDAFEAVAPGPQEADIAYRAFVSFGKGTGHPAGLNFGDLFSYALAKSRRLPLLFKGDDFARTDLVRATLS